MTIKKQTYLEHGIRREMQRAFDKHEDKLARFIDKQIREYNNGTLSAAKIADLETIPGWSWTTLVPYFD